MCIINTLFNRIDVSEGIDVNKTNSSKECGIITLSKGFNFQPNVCNRCHDLLKISTKFSDSAISSIKGFYYRFIGSVISKNDAISLMKNLDFNKNSGTLKNIKIY